MATNVATANTEYPRKLPKAAKMANLSSKGKGKPPDRPADPVSP
jgi:hypothetical protein